jgi:predicted nucleotidyltransferase
MEPEGMQDTLQSIIDIVTSEFEVDAIYLYGSRARASARPDSDWDLAVLFTTFERDLLERVLRPQHVEALLERQLGMYGLISVVDLEIVPPPLQMNIIRGKRIFDRGVPRVRRVEYSVISRIEKDYEHA